MNTLQLGALDYYCVKLAVASMFLDLIGSDEELFAKYEDFLEGWIERTEQQGKCTGMREHIESRDLGIEAVFNLLKQLDK